MSAPPGGSAGATLTGRTAFSLLLTLGLAVACRPNDDPIGPGTTNVGSRAFTVDTGAITPDGCNAINVRFTATTAAVAFPDPAACGTGWVLSSAGAATVARDSTKWRLTIPTKIRNQSSTARPNFLYLVHVPDSSIMLLPGSMYGQTPTPVGTSPYSSSPFGGMQFWGFLTTNYVAGGDYTASESLVLDFPVGTETAILRFAHANPSVTQPFATPTGVPAVPATWTAPEDSTLASASSGDYAHRVYRNFVAVEFAPGTSGAQIRAFLSANSAVIVGGSPSPDNPNYIVQIPDAGSYAAALAVVETWKSDAIVAAAFSMYFRPTLYPRDRFPLDASGMAKADWTATSDSFIRGWQAVDASKAWACENGRYGSTPVSVGILDMSFDEANTEFAGGVVYRPFVTPALSRLPFLQSGDPLAPRRRSHGTGVAGVVSAKGDDGDGSAGALWNAPLVLYPLVVDDSSTYQQVGAFLRSSVQAHLSSGHAPRILVSSTAFGGTPADMAIYRSAIADWLQADTKRMFVYAMENTPLGGFQPIRAFSNLTGGTSQVPPTDTVVADLAVAYPGRVLMVAAANPATGLVTSGLWDGGTQIAGPDRYIATVTRAEWGGGRGSFAGTSFAAPMVAGIAAQLMTMAPDLPADSVTYYILEGAKATRLDPSTGDTTVTPTALGSAGTSTIHLANAYETLKLYARRHATAPICGQEVTLDGDDVVIGRDTPQRIAISGASALWYLSVAQGGRRFVVSGNDGNDSAFTKTYRLQNGSWSLLSTRYDLERREFLEKDTLEVRFGCATADRCGAVVSLVGEGPVTLTNHLLTGPVSSSGIPNTPDQLNSGVEVSVSPDGRWAILASVGRWTGTPEVRLERIDAIDLQSLNVTSLRYRAGAVGTPPWGQGVAVSDSAYASATWNRTGSRAIVAFGHWTKWYATGGSFIRDTTPIKLEFLPVDFATSPSPQSRVVISGRFPSWSGYFISGDQVFTYYEMMDNMAGTTRRSRRSASSPGTELSWVVANLGDYASQAGYYPTGQLRADPGITMMPWAMRSRDELMAKGPRRAIRVVRPN